ncbi:hypothetical protein H6P81_016546 [Aristolochia fimbriata]|uniref:Protein kinase domain-containing protein n=1 Tax=Aristolochia fimbriata TaxID=158543 RepID=A0AAV7E9W6_ARIFI|nr:hypothetical protein H6P81_016546 [Aristolochia fimbriata]
MSEEMILHFTTNSNGSDPTLPSKLAKLEARMAGKGSSSAPAWQPSAGVPEELPQPSSSSDSDDNTGDAFLIRPTIQKRPRLEEDDHEIATQQSEELVDRKAKPTEAASVRSSLDDVNRKRQGRGRGRAATGKGRGSRTNDQSRNSATSTFLTSTSQIENSQHKISSDALPVMNHCVYSQEGRHKENFGKDERASLLEEVSSLRGKVASAEEELSRARKEASEHQQFCRELEKELRDIKEYEQQMKPKRLKVLSDLLISVSKSERQEARLKVRQDSLRLGNVGVVRVGTMLNETWEDGQALKDLNAHLKYLLETREGIERHRKSLKKRQTDKGDGVDSESVLSEEDFLVQDEIYKARLTSLKREEEMALRERDRYDLEKGRLIREMKRISDEDGSRFNNFQVLNHRYALLNLLGKGGFSEVYKAYDLVENRYVACKLHGLNAQWSEDKKQSYTRHAIREYNIHKSLVHRHIVRLWDTFEIDQNTFCTVLEYCSGKDLDAVLKATPFLPEREARIIIVQIFQGLVYLNKRPQKIIHYDLKPGNVLFDEVGVAKMTDFGLSKIVEDDVGSQGLELTSQGAGTYWYLPPECFELNKTPLISSRVDVWSAGVLLYQMLFGKRPFGHDQTQERILREDTIIKARKVEFPSRPAVSNEAKDLIRRCLTYDQAERPDVLTVAQDPYLFYTKK